MAYVLVVEKWRFWLDCINLDVAGDIWLNSVPASASWLFLTLFICSDQFVDVEFEYSVLAQSIYFIR